MKLLNIDAMANRTNKAVLIGGVQYEVQPISVGTFIKKTKEAEEYAQLGAIDTTKEVEIIVDLISQCIPAAPRHVIESLNLDQLQLIATYIQRDDVDGAEDVEGNA